LKLTTAKFYRISGGSTQHRGVTPDITLPALFDPKEVGESAQEFALPWDEIKAADFSGSRRLSNLIPQLEQRHRARLASSPAFTALQEEITAAKQARSKTTVSLLRSKRQAEWEEDRAKQRERENRRRVALGLPPLQADQDIPDPDDSSARDSAKDDKQPDMLLDESARILVDMIDLLDQQGGQRTMVMNADGKAAAGQ
jgi:carboxyl-terminal processing protease